MLSRKREEFIQSLMYLFEAYGRRLREEAKANSKAVITCSNCTNYGECPLLRYAMESRKSLCALMGHPHDYSEALPALKIPESNADWQRRLQNFTWEHKQ